jgi:ketosteroid isomerase-like protein
LSKENIAIVQSLYDAFARGDVPSVLGALSPGIEWREAENFPYADRNPYIGPDAVLQGIFMRVGAEWDGFAATPERLLDAGDTVVALGRYTGKYKATGKSVNAQFVHVWSLEDGKAVRFQQYTDTLQVAEAVLKGQAAVQDR